MFITPLLICSATDFVVFINEYNLSRETNIFFFICLNLVYLKLKANNFMSYFYGEYSFSHEL